MGTGTLVALVSVETRLHFLASTEPVGEAAEGLGTHVGVSGLGPPRHVTPWELVLVALRPVLPQVAVDLEGLLEAYVEVPAPPRQGLSACVPAIPSESLGFEPFQRELDRLRDVGASEASARQPLGVAPLVVGIEHAVVELQAGEGTGGVPLDFHRWVSVFA